MEDDNMTTTKHHAGQEHNMGRMHYVHLGIMTLLSFIAMFALMYSMVDRFANVYPNLNQFYMAATMAAPMVIIEVLIMHAMYKDRRLNMIIIGAAVLVLVLSFWAIRAQAGIDDIQFVKSMVPHHSGAILMCEQATITDAELKTLCNEIVKGQQQEIDQMKQILARLNR
jgi:uncharacterized protein (DUF305 family)